MRRKSIWQYRPRWSLNTRVDAAYKGPQVVAASRETGIGVEVVERNKDGPPGFYVIPKRWLVQCTRGWLNRERRLSKACDNPERERAWIYAGAMRLMARRLSAAS